MRPHILRKPRKPLPMGHPHGVITCRWGSNESRKAIVLSFAEYVLSLAKVPEPCAVVGLEFLLGSAICPVSGPH